MAIGKLLAVSRRAEMRAAALSALYALSCSSESAAVAGHFSEGWEASRDPASRSREPIEPLPRESAFERPLAELGRALFASPLLSGDGRVSCASCHSIEHGLADAKPTSGLDAAAGLPERPGPPLNSPSLYNVRYLFKLNWSGKFDALPEHLDALVHNPRVLDTTWDALVARLAGSPEWQQAFRAVFQGGPSADRVRRALVEYELSLVTPDAPFDRYLRGEENAISPDALSGYANFKSYGCSSCHQGMLVGGNMFQRLGIMRQYFDDAAALRASDSGRYDATGREEDRHVFRVPSLRNVELTAPYLHDGSTPTLESVIRIMATYQLGRSLEPEQVQQIIAFLRSLSAAPRSTSP
jgi:cytochrome c peroxidase